jgi:hypothetical protein
MTLRNKVDRIEKAIIGGNQDVPINNCFPGWTKEQLVNYVISGAKPEGKVIIPENMKDEIFNKFRNFSDWTKENIAHYIVTGELPEIAQKQALITH